MSPKEAWRPLLRGDPLVAEALAAFGRAYAAGGDRVGPPEWEAVAELYHDRLSRISRDNGWYDLFLIGADGALVYTVERESDLGMIIPGSLLETSSLGRAFASARGGEKSAIAIADFEPYAPSGGQQDAGDSLDREFEKY